MKPESTPEPETINFTYDTDKELYVSDPVDVPALKKAAVTFRFDLQTLDSAGWQRIRAAIDKLPLTRCRYFCSGNPVCVTSSTACILIWRMSTGGNNTCRIFLNLRCGAWWALSGISARWPWTITGLLIVVEAETEWDIDMA